MLFVFDELFSEEPQEIVSQKENLSVIRPIVRAERAIEDELFTVIDQLAISARIVTAITLQNGLIDGSIPSDEAFAELMNTGPVGFAQLEKFKQNNVGGIIGKLKGLKLTSSVSAKKLEETVTVLNKWKRMYAEVGDLNDFQLASDYFAKVRKFQNVTLDVKLISDTNEAIGDLIRHLNNMLTSSNMKAVDFMITFIGLLSKNQRLENFLNNVDGWITQLNKLNPLINSEFTLVSPHIKLVRLLNVYETEKTNVLTADPRDRTEVANMINSVLTALSGSDAELADFASLAYLVTSRMIPISAAPRNFTSGFVKGQFDLGMIPVDARIAATETLIELDDNTLGSGLEPLEEFSDRTNILEASWDLLSRETNVRAALKVREMIEKFATIREVAPIAAKSIANVSSCGSKRPEAKLSDSVITTLTNAIVLRTKLKNADRIVARIRKSPLLVDLKGLVEMKHFLPPTVSIDLEDVPSLVAKFRTFKDAQKYIDTLTELKPLVEGLAKEFATVDVNKLLKNLPGDLDALRGFMADSETKTLIRYFDSLKSADEIESVAASVKLIQEIRDLQKDSLLVEEISTIAGVIESSLPSLKSLRSDFGYIGNSQNLESKLLMQLKSLGEEAKDFGDAVSALDNVKKVLEKIDTLEQFIIDGWSVEEVIEKLTDKTINRELEEDWGDFGKTVSEINSFLPVLVHRRNLLVIPKASKFADYGPVFTAFSELKDVDLRAEKRKKTLKTLALQNREMVDVKELFDQLARLDLQFSKFSLQLSEMPRTLANLDLAFAQYQAPNASPPPVSQNLSRSAPSFSTATTASLFYPIVVGVVLATIACVIVIAVGVLSIREHRRVKRISKKRAYNAEE